MSSTVAPTDTPPPPDLTREVLGSSDGAELPPGPRLPRLVQTLLFNRRAQWMLGQCARRFGETFTLRLLHESAFVVISDPDEVKQIFTGDPQVLHAGAGNRILLPVLGPHSLLLLDGDAHLRERRLMLPPFHGARMQSYLQLMTEVAAGEIDACNTCQKMPPK